MYSKLTLTCFFGLNRLRTLQQLYMQFHNIKVHI